MAELHIKILRALQLVLILSLSILFVLTFQGTSSGQEEKQYNSHYRPISVILRLSYENFKNIKLINAAVINFGGSDGREQIENLINEYAKASSLYFINEFEKSANEFSINEKNIQKVATTVAKLYKERTVILLEDTIKRNVKTVIKLSVREKKVELHPAIETAILGGSASISKANDYLVRARPIEAIYHYRRAKTSFFRVYGILKSYFTRLSKHAQYIGAKKDYEYFSREAQKIQFPEQYEKDKRDNMNRIYEVKEKSPKVESVKS